VVVQHFRLTAQSQENPDYFKEKVLDERLTPREAVLLQLLPMTMESRSHLVIWEREKIE